jgi:CheY-like chemotaxis protein
MSRPASRPVVVVDDNPDDIFFFKRCYTKANAAAPLVVATDGEEAIATLERLADENARGDDGPPLLIFLDLKLPRVSGFSVLEWIRRRRDLDEVPVAILSSSAEARDVTRAYALGAQTYLVKHPQPADMAALIAAAARVQAPDDLAKLKLPGLARPKT